MLAPGVDLFKEEVKLDYYFIGTVSVVFAKTLY